MSAHRGSYLLYLNGLEIPCPSVSVTCGVGQIPEATFSLAPHPLMQRLGSEDRLEVVVFYLDDTWNPTSPQWCLLFEGEIIGWSYANTPMGTKMSFTALMDIAIFSQLSYSFMTANDVMGQALNPVGDTVQATQPGAFYPFSLFKKGLLYGVQQGNTSGVGETVTPDITRPFEILFNAVRGMMDEQLQSKASGTPPAVPLINFFARWARKRNFVNKFAALPVFEDADSTGKATAVFPILDAVQDDYAMKTLSQGLAAGGNQGSMWSVLQQVFTTMYFEIAMLPTAPAYRVRLSDGSIQGLDGHVDIPDPDRYKNPMRLMNYFVKPQTVFGIPPACNVIFPSMLKSLEYSENYMAQPTRYYVNDQLITGMLHDDATVAAALTFGYPEVVNAAMRAKVGGEGEKKAKDVMSSGRNVLVYPEEFYKGPVSERSEVPSWFTILMNKHKANKAKADAAALSSSATDPASESDITTLFDTYVRYEYFRKRYEKRGGSAQLHWNPYIVPGFPCFIFDRRHAGMDVVGYVQTVSWSMSTQGLSTSITYGYGRTAQEFLQTQYEESVRFGILGAGPAEPLPTVRAIVQDPGQAEKLYQGLFHGRGTVARGGTDKPAAALMHTLVGVKTSTGPESLELTKGDGSPVITPHIPKVNGIPDFNIELEPLKESHGFFYERDDAMQYIARPICTLEEYRRFREGKYPDAAPTEMDKGAPYYRRIYSLRQGPAVTAPDGTMTGAVGTGVGSSGESGTATLYTGPKSAVPQNFPQTRIDWDTILETYKAALAQDPPLT